MERSTSAPALGSWTMETAKLLCRASAAWSSFLVSLCFHNNKFRLGWIYLFPSTHLWREELLWGTECGVGNWNDIISSFQFLLLCASTVSWVELVLADYMLFFHSAVPKRVLVCLQTSSCALKRDNTELAFLSDTQTKASEAHGAVQVYSPRQAPQLLCPLFHCTITLCNLCDTTHPSRSFQMFHFVMCHQNKADVPFTIKLKEQQRFL